MSEFSVRRASETNAPDDDDLRWLTRDEAAAYAQVNPATISRAVKTQQLACVRLFSARTLRFRRAWIDAWLERGYRPAAA